MGTGNDIFYPKIGKGTKGECFKYKINELCVIVGGFFKEYVEWQKSWILDF